MAEPKANKDSAAVEQDSANEPVFVDVAKPGSSPAPATSRPIIGHRAMMRDPMMADQTSKSDAIDEEDKPKTPLTSKGKTIQPSADSELGVKPETEAAKPPAEEAQVEPAEKPKKSLEEAAVDAYAEQMVKKKKPSKEDEEKLAEIQKHIEEKTYFVPIGQVKKRRAKRRLLVVLFILLVLLGAYIALDAGLLGLDVALPVDLIKQ